MVGRLLSKQFFFAFFFSLPATLILVQGPGGRLEVSLLCTVLLFRLDQRFGPWFRCRLPSRSAHFAAAFVDIILRGSGIHGTLFPIYFLSWPLHVSPSRASLARHHVVTVSSLSLPKHRTCLAHANAEAETGSLDD